MSGVKTLRKYTLELWGSHGGHVKVPMSADALNRRRAQHLATVFEALVAIAQERLEPALRHRFSSAVGAGRPVTIGSLSLAPAGLTFDRKLLSDRSVPWSSFAGTDIDHGEVRVFMRNGESTRMAGTVPLATRDAVLLPELLRELADLFS